jgi:group II intron reverse transcriptase/maturase
MNTEKLLEKILSAENMEQAIQQVKRNKGAAGVDGMTVKELEAYWKANGEEIKQQIRVRKYKPSPVLRVEIPKPNGGVRELGIPTVNDRCIQQAIAQVLTPIFEKQFHENSYGFRPNRCAEQAIRRTLELLNQHYTWIVDIDLEKFFDTVDHDRLMNLVARSVEDGDVVSLIRKYLVSGVMIDDEYKESVIGTPQGGNLSPLLSNIMLNELDKELEVRGLNFVRYADDCIILTGSEKSADRVMTSITKFIENKLGLKVNASKSRIETPKELKYLGFGFYFDSYAKQYKARPHETSIAKLKAKIKELTSRRWSVSMDERIMRLNWLVRGWVNYFRIARMKTMCREIDKHTRFRLRMCIWKQWKKPRTKYKALMKLGISKGQAWQWANSRKGYARIASSIVMQRAVTTEILKRKGLISLSDHYQSVHI